MNMKDFEIVPIFYQIFHHKFVNYAHNDFGSVLLKTKWPPTLLFATLFFLRQKGISFSPTKIIPSQRMPKMMNGYTNAMSNLQNLIMDILGRFNKQLSCHRTQKKFQKR